MIILARCLLALLVFSSFINTEFLYREGLFPVSIAPTKILVILILFFVIVDVFIRNSSYPKQFYVVSAYIGVTGLFTILISLLNSQFAIQDLVARYIVQLVAFIATFAFGYGVVRNYGFSKDGWEVTIYACISIVIVGVIFQFIFFKGFQVTPRLYGVSGEPKGLFLNLIPLIFSLKVIDQESIKVKFFLVVTSLIGFLTFSLTGFFAFLLLYYLFARSTGEFFYRAVFSLMVLLISAYIFNTLFSESANLMFMKLASVYLSDGIKGIHHVVNVPVIGNMVLDGNDAPCFSLLIDYSVWGLSGTGLGMCTFPSHKYLQEWGGSGFLNQDYQGYIVPNSALLNGISDFGIILFGVFIIIIIKLKKYINLQSKNSSMIIFLYCHLVISILVMRTALPIGFLLGFIYGIYRKSTTESKIKLSYNLR